ncbi:LacI family DNA-binding transcriptional regulator [Sphingomonas sp. MG17]|uniref:LacI family DNA-binding transcriptional regulator n=1 Tax=Sphingomonas tagetis TaxID=2949092 RepID=A0A9X2HSJ6_9SPHN|nr:LacI family DNA-binding transcriptional regulator [Sphingomonas tagetis]MCP3731810.1 LacI family DNA-binding transcriptional regulator [Sphingomonas tagetis]
MLPHTLRAFDDRVSYTTPERRLMLATIANAVIDALGNSADCRTGPRENARRDALNWFKLAGPDYQMVCHLAGLDPACTRRAVLRYVASGKPMPAIRRGNRSTRHGGVAKPAMHGATQADIAAQAGVSPATVRNVLNGTGQPSLQMRERVRRAMRELADLRDAA